MTLTWQLTANHLLIIGSVILVLLHEAAVIFTNMRTKNSADPEIVAMKTKRTLQVVALIGVLALISAAYCFRLMTVPLSYDRVYIVVFGFIASLTIFVIALISSFILCIRLRRLRSAPPDSKINPTV